MQSACSLVGTVTTSSIRRWEAECYDRQSKSAKRGFVSKKNPVRMVRSFHVGPVHHNMSLGMPWVIRWKMSMRPRQRPIEVCALGASERTNPSVLPIALKSCRVRRVESASRDNEGEVTPMRCRTAAWNGGNMCAVSHSCASEANMLGDSLQFTHEKQ